MQHVQRGTKFIPPPDCPEDQGLQYMRGQMGERGRGLRKVQRLQNALPTWRLRKAQTIQAILNFRLTCARESGNSPMKGHVLSCSAVWLVDLSKPRCRCGAILRIQDGECPYRCPKKAVSAANTTRTKTREAMRVAKAGKSRGEYLSLRETVKSCNNYMNTVKAK
jgi:hypothetical protein